jgi:TPR repeat protein
MKNFIILIISIIAFSCNAETIDSVLTDINNGNVKEGIEKLERLANNNDNVAQFQLGKLYYDGIKIERSYGNAYKWLLKSAENNNSDAQLMVAIMYEEGNGVFGDTAESLKWYEKASTKSNIAKYKLGSYIMFKQTSKYEPVTFVDFMQPEMKADIDEINKAEKLLSEAGKSGIVDAYCVLGRGFSKLYVFSAGLNTNFKEKIIKYYSIASELNDIEAMVMINTAYNDEKNEINNLRRAAEYGLGYAFYRLYLKHFYSKNTEITRVEAYKSILLAEKLLGHNIRVEQKFLIDKLNFTKEEIEEATRLANEWKPIPLPPAPVVKNP